MKMGSEDKRSERFVHMEKRGFIATLVLDRPAVKNSLNIGMLIRIVEYLDELSATDNKDSDHQGRGWRGIFCRLQHIGLLYSKILRNKEINVWKRCWMEKFVS